MPERLAQPVDPGGRRGRDRVLDGRHVVAVRRQRVGGADPDPPEPAARALPARSGTEARARDHDASPHCATAAEPEARPRRPSPATRAARAGSPSGSGPRTRRGWRCRRGSRRPARAGRRSSMLDRDRAHRGDLMSRAAASSSSSAPDRQRARRPARRAPSAAACRPPPSVRHRSQRARSVPSPRGEDLRSARRRAASVRTSSRRTGPAVIRSTPFRSSWRSISGAWRSSISSGCGRPANGRIEALLRSKSHAAA